MEYMKKTFFSDFKFYKIIISDIYIYMMLKCKELNKILVN